MPRKKSKRKKNKKERKKRRASASSCEDQGKEDTERRRSGERDKNKHVRSESTDRPQSAREIQAKSRAHRKSDKESMKVKSEAEKDSHGRKHCSVKHSSSQRDASTSTKSSSSYIPKAPAKEEHECTSKNLGKRKSSSEEPGKRASEGEEKMKKLIKRKASTDDDYPVTKQRSGKEQTDADKRVRKELAEEEYRKWKEERVSEWKRSSHEKSPSQNLFKELKHVASDSISPHTSRDKPSSSSFKISFKIPKKSSVVKTQKIVAANWQNDKKSPITSKCLLKAIEAPTVKVTPEQTTPSRTEVPSPVPTRSPPVQSSATEKTGVTSSSNALVQHVSCYDSPERTETTDDDDYEMQIVEELHLARSNRQLHVNVEESYGELTSMDVDPADESATTALSLKQQQDLLIVLDTNVLLSHLDFVKKIRSRGLGALGFPTLLVPWVVLQELDSLKSGKLSKNVERKAQPAVNYIYTCLKDQEPRLWGQSMQQVSQAACGLDTMNNDDRVLQCCLQYKALYPEGTVVLCTNDKNLCSKALLSGVTALSKADLQEQAEVNPDNFHQRSALTSSYTHAAPDKQHQEEKVQRSCEKVETGRKEETERELSECVSVFESSLQRALSAVLEEEMKAAFGELWLEIVYVKPPWTLDALLQCFRKHWIAVFGAIIRRSLISCVETLSRFVHTDVQVNRGSVLNVVSAAEELLTALRCRSPYSGHVDSALSHLENLKHRLQAKPQKSPVVDREGDTLMADAVQDVAPPSHQEVWAVFESIWNNVCRVRCSVYPSVAKQLTWSSSSFPSPVDVQRADVDQNSSDNVMAPPSLFLYSTPSLSLSEVFSHVHESSGSVLSPLGLEQRFDPQQNLMSCSDLPSAARVKHMQELSPVTISSASAVDVVTSALDSVSLSDNVFLRTFSSSSNITTSSELMEPESSITTCSECVCSSSSNSSDGIRGVWYYLTSSQGSSETSFNTTMPTSATASSSSSASSSYPSSTSSCLIESEDTNPVTSSSVIYLSSDLSSSADDAEMTDRDPSEPSKALQTLSVARVSDRSSSESDVIYVATTQSEDDSNDSAAKTSVRKHELLTGIISGSSEQFAEALREKKEENEEVCGEAVLRDKVPEVGNKETSGAISVRGAAGLKEVASISGSVDDTLDEEFN